MEPVRKPMYLKSAGGSTRQEANDEEITELYADLRPSLKAYLGSTGLDPGQSEDVIQEAFLRLVRQAVKGAEQNPRAWVFRVAHNLSMDHHRLERRRPRSTEERRHPAVLQERADPSPNPEEKMLLMERISRFRVALGQLTPKQRDCVLLRAKGLLYREIALELGVSVQRVGEIMQRAISSLGEGV